MKKSKTLMVMSAAAILLLAACGPTELTSSAPDKPTSSGDNISSSSEDKPSSSEIDEGDGSIQNPFKLSNKEDLIALQQEVNDSTFNGYVSDISQAPYFQLTNDIDLGGMEWTPIGGSLNQTASNLFSANFDGAGHKITNFKITETDTMISSYGLFGNFHGHIENLTVDNFTIDLSPANVYTNTFVGGVCGLADITHFTNVNVDGSIKVRYNKSNVDFYIGGLAGYNVTYATEYNGKVLGNVTNTRFVNTNVKIDSNVANTFAGGITGWAGTTSGEGILNIAYVTSKGRLVTPNITGGIVGYLDKYATISYAQVLGNVEGGANVGGIAAIAASDSAIQNSYVASKQIIAASLTASYEFEGGYISGLFTLNNEPENDSKSTLLRNVYRSDATVLSVAGTPKEDPHHTKVATISQLIDAKFLKDNLEYSDSEWTFSNNNYPTLKIINKTDLKNKSKVKFVSNLTGVDKADAEVFTYTYTGFDTFVSKKGYTFKGWFYDVELTQDYRFYLPVYGNKTLYGDWANYSDFAGMYVATNNNAGILDFDNEGGLNFYYGDYTYIKGSYEYYGNYIKFGSPESYDWYDTYGSWDAKTGELKFKASDNNATEFTYVKANEIIGFYRNGPVSIDFITANAGTITLVKGFEVVEIPFAYSLTSTGVNAQSKDGKLTSINVLNDGSIKFVYDGTTFENNIKLPFIGQPSQAPYLNKTYRGPELNNGLGVKDITFNDDGTATFRHSYQRTSASHEQLDVDFDLVDESKGIYGATKTRDGQNDSEFYLDVYGLQKHDVLNTYSYVEMVYYIKNGQTVDQQAEVLATNLTKTVDSDGVMVFQGSGQRKGSSTLNIYEVRLDLENAYMDVTQFATYNHKGGYYADGNDVIIKGDGSDQAMQTVLKYNQEKDYFVTKSFETEYDVNDPTLSTKHEKYFMLAPYEIYGVFDIKGVDNLKGQIYAYKGHTFYLDIDGTVSEVSVTSGTFKNFDTINLNIKSEQHSFKVINQYGLNTLTLVK